MGRVVWAWGAMVLIAAAQTPPDPTVTFQEADLARGKKLFQAHCGPCHGIDGSGGRGANLRVANLRRAPDNLALFEVARTGIEGTSMGPNWQLSDGELWRVVAYVRSIGRIAASSLPGDPSRGQALYAQQGCANCHIVNGSGRALGPELSSIGAGRNAAYLREALVEPAAVVPEEFALVRLDTREGRPVEGLRVNEDSFTIQIRGLDGKLQSFRKSEVTGFQLETGKSAMPSYAGRLSPGEIDDLVAYLAGLRGKP